MLNLRVVLILEVENAKKNSAQNIIDQGLQDYWKITKVCKNLELVIN